MRVDELARDVGISKRTLYEQFRTKEEMAQEALVRLDQKLQESIERILGDNRGESEKLRDIILHVSQAYARARPPFFRDLETAPPLVALVEASNQRCYLAVEQIVRSGMTKGSFRSDLEPRLVRRTLLAAVQTIVRAEVLAQDRMSLETAYSGIVDLVLHGMLARSN